jgi:hypothetical protein
MSRRKQAQNEAVAERAQQILAEKAQRRRGRKAAEAEAPTQPAAAQATRPKRERPPREHKERKPRVHRDLLTVAFRGPLAGKFRELAERHQLSLSKLLQDALLAWEANVAAGYQPGTALAEWKAQHPKEAPTV